MINEKVTRGLLIVGYIKNTCYKWVSNLQNQNI